MATPPQLLPLVLRHGRDAVAFQGLGPKMRAWLDRDGAVVRGAVAYADTGSAWVAAGGPIAPDEARAGVAERFANEARAAGRRAVFFAVEELGAFAGDAGWQRVHLGEQPIMTPDGWTASLKKSRALREQLRRARAKGVVARSVLPDELAPDHATRMRIDHLVALWLMTRRIEPMGFLVTADPYVTAEHHRYWVAERGGTLVGFLSSVPAYEGSGWLVEHLVVMPGAAPNGTAETLFHAMHGALASSNGNAPVSLGLAPLAGHAPWQRALRFLTRPLYDFEGLFRFKKRLHPGEWRAVWMLVPAGTSPLWALLDVLAAFAGGHLVRFAVQSLLRRPRGLLWLLAMGLVPWTLVLAWLDAWGEEGDLGYTRIALLLWILFDVALAASLFRLALRPAYPVLLLLLALAFGDAMLSSFHLGSIGLDARPFDCLLRVLSTVAPWVGTATLLFIAYRRPRDLRALHAPSAALDR